MNSDSCAPREKDMNLTVARWWQVSLRSSSLRLVLACLGGCAVLRAQPAVNADIGQMLSIGLVIDTHPQQAHVIEFERQVLDSLTHVLAGAPAKSFVLSYSDRVRLIEDWSPMDSGLLEASARIAVDDEVRNNRGAVLNDGVMNGLTKLGSSPEGDRRSLIVVGEGNDGGSTAKFSEVLDSARAKHIQCFVLLVADHRSQVGRVRQFGFDLYRLASGSQGKAYDVRTNPRSLDAALKDVLKRLVTPAR